MTTLFNDINSHETHVHNADLFFKERRVKILLETFTAVEQTI